MFSTLWSSLPVGFHSHAQPQQRAAHLTPRFHRTAKLNLVYQLRVEMKTYGGVVDLQDQGWELLV